VIPVIIGATGTISKTFRKYVSNIPGNHEVKELQKTAIMGTAHITVSLILTRTYYINTVLNNNHSVSETASTLK
jgi:hypothetical protein